LKDHHRAKLMGSTSFGKGSVQSVLPLDDSRALKLTTAHYFTPSGQSIHEIGIVPDIEFSGDEESLLDEAVQVLKLEKVKETRQARL
jgi:carboxyl-terminal processing protease